MRTILISAWLGLLVMVGGAAPVLAQAGFDRPGRDYSNFVVRSGDPADCGRRCDSDARCQAWSFSYPTTRGTPAMCWLKSQVPTRAENACCLSGVKGGGVIEPRTGGIEFGMDRVGGDYRNFETSPQPNGEACAAACSGENRCRAWTYVRPGYIGTSARCFLKNRVTPPRRKPCCVSGVVR